MIVTIVIYSYFKRWKEGVNINDIKSFLQTFLSGLPEGFIKDFFYRRC